MTQFPIEIRSRIAETRHQLTEAKNARDDYLVEVHLGELESLARLAADNGVPVEGVEEAFAEHGRQTPPLGMAGSVELRGTT